jgi:hypothetical protein
LIKEQRMKRRKAKTTTRKHCKKKAKSGRKSHPDPAREAEIALALLKQSPVLYGLVSNSEQPIGSVLDLLVASVGRPWADVRRKLAAMLKSATSSSQDAQLTADAVAGEFVNLAPVMRNMVPYWKIDGRLMKPWPCFVQLYVDPNSGLLCRYEEEI